jgi:hypothetical protein
MLDVILALSALSDLWHSLCWPDQLSSLGSGLESRAVHMLLPVGKASYSLQEVVLNHASILLLGHSLYHKSSLSFS